MYGRTSEEYAALFFIFSSHFKSLISTWTRTYLILLKLFPMCFSNRVIRTSLQQLLRWLIRNHILQWKSFLTLNMSNSTSTNLASELTTKISAKLPSVNMFLREDVDPSWFTQSDQRYWPLKSYPVLFFYLNSQGLGRTKMLLSWYTK